MGFWKRQRVRDRGLMQRVSTEQVYSTDSKAHSAAVGKPETVKVKAEWRRPKTAAERSGSGVGSAWREAPPAHKLPSRKAGSRLTRVPHRAGKMRSMSIPDYSTGDESVDALQASIARDLLRLLG